MVIFFGVSVLEAWLFKGFFFNDFTPQISILINLPPILVSCNQTISRVCIYYLLCRRSSVLFYARPFTSPREWAFMTIKISWTNKDKAPSPCTMRSPSFWSSEELSHHWQPCQRGYGQDACWYLPPSCWARNLKCVVDAIGRMVRTEEMWSWWKGFSPTVSMLMVVRSWSGRSLIGLSFITLEEVALCSRISKEFTQLSMNEWGRSYLLE